MDSWNYGSDGNDALARSRTVVMGWDLNNNTRLDSGRDVDGNNLGGFMELGFPDITRKPNSFGGILDARMGSSMVSSSTCISKSMEFTHEDTSSRFSSTAGDSESLLIDLKLGGFADYQTGKSQEEMPRMGSTVSSLPEKRARTVSLTYQTPLCQVLGCNLDLSNSKDYHKRHKVCDAHSKTAKVIVNGIEQRFCQQCSRFHLLAEFDDGKRSCRKRLAGHNERRRKPQVDNQTGRNGKLHLPYNGMYFAGARFLGTSLPLRTSFSSDMFHGGNMQPVKYQTSNWCRPIKVEEQQYYSPSSAMPTFDQQMLPKSSLSVFGGNKQYSFLHSTGINTAGTSNSCENNNRYPHTSPDEDSIPRFGMGTTPSGREDITIYDTEPTTGASVSSSALSLLSSQSQNSSTHSSGMPTGQPLFIQGNHSHYNLDQFSGKPFGLSPQASTSLSSNRFSSSMEFDRFDPIVASDASNSVDFDLQTDGIFQGSEFMSSKDPFSHEHSPTVDLLQLSSQLQRVEHQRNSMQIKQENNTYFCLPIT